MIDDFSTEIERHPRALKVIREGQSQIDRLKGSLLQWVRELLAGQYDEAYIDRRWQVGRRHAGTGLDQAYTNVALSRLRASLSRAIRLEWQGDPPLLLETIQSLNKRLDLELAIIEGASQAEFWDRLQRAERLATLGQVAGGIAHELRNPLDVMKTSVWYLLNAQYPTPEKQAEHLGRIERQVELANGVITALANFARLPTLDLRPISLEPSLREVLGAEPLGDAIDVHLDLPPSLPPVLANTDQLLIVFGNLVRNARDAMPGRGRLAVAGQQVGETVEVAIADTGVGIPPADLARIIEPLYSTKARGLGLGLAIVRSILAKCAGDLRVSSELGRGSVFA